MHIIHFELSVSAWCVKAYYCVMLSLSSNIKKAMFSKTKSLGSIFNFILPERDSAQHTEFGKPTQSITTISSQKGTTSPH